MGLQSSSMKIAITGSTGLVGTRLVAALEAAGHQTAPLTRHRDRPGVYWDPTGGHVDDGLEACDAVVHLAGAPIAEKRWNESYKAAIRDSRVLGTQTLCAALRELPARPLISTSAIGFYGDRDDELLTEESLAGTGFLAQVGQAWEKAVDVPGRAAIVRVGLVLSPDGGLLEPLLPLFKVGGGGPVGSGSQWMSWIHVDDLVGLYVHLITHDQAHGVFNGVAPNPVQNHFFSKVLGRVLHRPAVVPAPAFAVRLALGREKANELVLASQRVKPERTLDAGFRFAHPKLQDALSDLLT